MKSRFYNTLIFQVCVCFALLLVCFVIFTQASFAYLERQEEISADIDAVNQPNLRINNSLNFISSQTGSLRQSVKSSTDYLTYVQEREMLCNAAAELKELLCRDAYNRDAVDLYYIVGSFCDVCDKIWAHYAQNDYLAVIDLSEQMDTYAEYIRTTLNLVAEDIALRNGELQIQSNQLRLQHRRLMLVMGCIVGFVCLFVALYLLRQVVLPIRKIIAAIEKFRLTNDAAENHVPALACPPGTLSEVRSLAAAVNEMQSNALEQHAMEIRNEALHSQLAEEKLAMLAVEKQLQETELKALQAQINPHFLFNTLNIISQMSYLEQANQTTELLETFSELFRYNVDKFNRNVTLRDEMENVQGYIRLQKARFGDRIVYHTHIDAELEDVQVPCLIIQPLVENAISHGLRSCTAGGVVKVSIECKSEGFIISVADNGCGMRHEDVEKLYHRVCGINGEKYNADHTSIGIANVYQRMKIFFGDDLRFSARSTLGEGFEIVLFVAHMKEDDDELHRADRG